MTEWSSTNGCLTISNPMEVIPTSVCLTTYDGGPEDFILTHSMNWSSKSPRISCASRSDGVFKLGEIVEAHRCMEENRAGGKIVVLT